MTAIATARRHIGKTPCCGTVIVQVSGLARIERACPNHRAVVIDLKPVRGKVTTHPCDSRCTTATGALCECECGGINHGCEWDMRTAVPS